MTTTRPMRIVSYEFEPDNFDPGDALEHLRSHVTDIEALIDAANQALQELPPPRERQARRAFSKLYSLLGASAETAHEAVLAGERYVAGLARHLKTNRQRK